MRRAPLFVGIGEDWRVPRGETGRDLGREFGHGRGLRRMGRGGDCLEAWS